MNQQRDVQSNVIVFFRLLLLFRSCWGWMTLGILLSLITVLANVGLLALAGWFISIMAIAGVAGTSVNYFTPSAAIRGLAIMRTAGRYIERVVSHEATFRLLAKLREWFYIHLEPLAPAVLQGYRSGDILSRISADIDTLQNLYLRILSPVVVALLACALYGIFIAQYNIALLLFIMPMLLVAAVIVPIVIYRISRKSGQRQVQTKSDLRSSVIDSIQGMGELLIYNYADEQQHKTSLLSNELIRDQKTQTMLSGFSQGFVVLCANVTLWIVLLTSIPLLGSHQIQAESVVMLALFALASFEVVLPLPYALQLVPETLAAARRLFEIVDARHPVSEPEPSSSIPDNYDIRFDQVSFSYDRKPVLKNLSFTLKTGKTLALRGASGAGKSTVANLLIRFWELAESDSGNILFGGYPLHSYQSDELRKYFAVLPQQSMLFNNTIKSNLLLANPAANDMQLEEVCKVARVHEFIASQPDGYNTWVGEAGLLLSGGQARRICIARVLLKDSPVLILDEPSEGLDAKTERELLQAVFAYRRDASILLITHKTSGLDLVDEIVHMGS